MLAGRFLKKYKLRYMVNSFISVHMYKKFMRSRGIHIQKKRSDCLDKETESVQTFLEEELHSSIAPGKKDFITRKKHKVQKQYLHDSITALHKKYMREKGKMLSYKTFKRLKPFWFLKPRIQERDTCLCVKHVNMDFMLHKLHFLKILKSTSTSDLCSSVCCSSNDKKCMYGECSKCTVKTLPGISQDNGEEQIFYHQWINKTEKRIDKKKNDLTVKFVAKVKVVSTVQELVSNVEKQLPAYLKHVYNVGHQFRSLREIKTKLNDNEVLILVDFSENFVGKYNKEIHSAHFGAAKTQITLHTGVLYHNNAKLRNNVDQNKSESTMNCESPQPQCLSFCSISSSLRHDPPAIWAHLMLILKIVREQLPLVDTVHFQSDGPSTQYRNKKNFYLMTHFSNAFGWKNST